MSTPEKKTERQEKNFNALLQAVKMCLLQNEGIRSAARQHGVDKSSLQRHLNKVKANIDDVSSVNDGELLEIIRTSSMKIPSNMVCYFVLLLHLLSFFFLMNSHLLCQVFSIAQEKVLVEYIIKCVNHYYGLSINELRELAYQLAKKLNLDYPSAWNEDLKAGRKWYYMFIKRHPELTLRRRHHRKRQRRRGQHRQPSVPKGNHHHHWMKMQTFASFA